LREKPKKKGEAESENAGQISKARIFVLTNASGVEKNQDLLLAEFRQRRNQQA